MNLKQKQVAFPQSIFSIIHLTNPLEWGDGSVDSALDLGLESLVRFPVRAKTLSLGTPSLVSDLTVK